MQNSIDNHKILKFLNASTAGLAILIDPDKEEVEGIPNLVKGLPVETTCVLVGGSRVEPGKSDLICKSIKLFTSLPVMLFPGDEKQLSSNVDAVLFLSLVSGRNPEFLINQHVKAVPFLRKHALEVIPTAYLLIDGETRTAVREVTQTQPIPQDSVQLIVDTCLAAKFLGMQLIYLEAGSGAQKPVDLNIIKKLKQEIDLPIMVGGGIRSLSLAKEYYKAGARMVVVGTAYEQRTLK
ncbi:geranylgeranylglyceryl/heptaprenylglyceryl phosphate synthase [uncultured Mesonia sp.]|uniref:geranylgeranylglyceryl/heptaprenylglyceryl phosphate synthase n=1 Tax=uncultured Mesonia sp. TaxID=399731 RepID=UPI00374EF301